MPQGDKEEIEWRHSYLLPLRPYTTDDEEEEEHPWPWLNGQQWWPSIGEPTSTKTMTVHG
jgi:hypothetical protein